MAEGKAPLGEAATRIRDTAKWLTVSLAVLGGVLTAGTQLSSVGSLVPWSFRFWVAVVAGILAALGAGLILLKAVKTATTSAVSLQTLADTKTLDQDRFLLQGYGSVEDLRGDFERKIQSRNEALRAYSAAKDNDERAKAKISLENADADFAFAQQVAANVLQVASFLLVANTWKRSALFIAGGALIASIGTVAFVWAINPPKSAEGSAATPAVLSTPTPGRIVLTDNGRSVIGTKLGSECSNRTELTALHLGDTASGPDVLIQASGCNAVRLVLGSDWGSFSK